MPRPADDQREGLVDGQSVWHAFFCAAVPCSTACCCSLGAPVFLVLFCCCCSRPVHLHRRTSWYLIHPARRQSSLPSLNSCTLPCRPRPPPSRLPSPLSPLLTPRSRPSASLNHTPGTFSRFQVVLPLPLHCSHALPHSTALHCRQRDFHSHDNPLLARAPAAARPAVSPLSSAHRYCQQHHQQHQQQQQQRPTTLVFARRASQATTHGIAARPFGFVRLHIHARSQARVLQQRHRGIELSLPRAPRTSNSQHFTVALAHLHHHE